MIPYLTTSGPSWDLEIFSKERGKGYIKLPDPAGPPFKSQALPIPDFQQKHVQQTEVAEAVGTHETNPLIFGRFVGTHLVQTNQPGFLSVNERTNNWV